MFDYSQYSTPSDEWLQLSGKIPAPPAGLSLAERADLINKQREKRSAEDLEPLLPKVRMRDHVIPTRDSSNIQARSYRTTDCDKVQSAPVVLYLHGGGFFSGTIASEDAVCSRIAINTNTVVLNVCYRHIPEHTYPTAWDDTEDAFEWLHDHINELDGDPQRVVIAGISSGAYLAASFVLGKHLDRTCASRPPIAGQILMVPSLINMDCHEPMTRRFKDPSVCSVEQNKDAPLLPLSMYHFLTVGGGLPICSPNLGLIQMPTEAPPGSKPRRV